MGGRAVKGWSVQLKDWIYKRFRNVLRTFKMVPLAFVWIGLGQWKTWGSPLGYPNGVGFGVPRKFADQTAITK